MTQTFKDSSSTDYLSPHPGSTHGSTSGSPTLGPASGQRSPDFLASEAPLSEHHSTVTLPTIHAPAPVQGHGGIVSAPTSDSAHPESGHDGGSQGGSGTGTPKAKFLETLQSKSAWDALIHGSFS